MTNNKLLLLKPLCFQMVCNAVRGFPGGAGGKEPACQWKKHKTHEFHPWVGKIPWRKAWQPTLVFLLGESHGQRSLVGYSPVPNWTAGALLTLLWGLASSPPAYLTTPLDFWTSITYFLGLHNILLALWTKQFTLLCLWKWPNDNQSSHNNFWILIMCQALF